MPIIQKCWKDHLLFHELQLKLQLRVLLAQLCSSSFGRLPLLLFFFEFLRPVHQVVRTSEGRQSFKETETCIMIC